MDWIVDETRRGPLVAFDKQRRHGMRKKNDRFYTSHRQDVQMREPIWLEEIELPDVGSLVLKPRPPRLPSPTALSDALSEGSTGRLGQLPPPFEPAADEDRKQELRTRDCDIPSRFAPAKLDLLNHEERDSHSVTHRLKKDQDRQRGFNVGYAQQQFELNQRLKDIEDYCNGTLSHIYINDGRDDQMDTKYDGNGYDSIVAGTLSTDSGYQTQSKEGLSIDEQAIAESDANILSISTDNEGSIVAKESEREIALMFADHLRDKFTSVDGTQFVHAKHAIAELLSRFSLLKAPQAIFESDRTAVVSMRRSRNLICSRLAQQSNSEFTRRNLRERIMQWNANLSSQDIGVPVTPDKALEPVDDLAEMHNLEPSDTSEIVDSVRFLVNGNEHAWLIHCIEREIALDMSTKRTQVGASDVFEEFARFRQATGAGDHDVCLDLQWNPIRFVKRQFGAEVDIRHTIVIVGDPTAPYATTCDQYVQLMWPTYGNAVLDCLQEFIDNEQQQSRSYIEATSLSISQLGLNKIRMEAQGNIIILSEILDMIVWVATACRESYLSDALGTCRPTIVESNRSRMAFNVGFEMQAVDSSSNLHGGSGCWTKMFRNAVITDTYPAPKRLHDEQGLEMAAEVMILLAQTFWSAHYCGKFMLKGFNSLLTPSKCHDASTTWHFLVHKDGSRISYNEGFHHSSITTWGDVFFKDARHFVGWSHNVDIIAGAPTGHYSNIGRSQSSQPSPVLIVKPDIEISGGKYVNVAIKARRGRKDTPLYLQSNSFWYEQKMHNASLDWNVVFSDTLTRRHWLFDGATAILQICQACIGSDEIPYTDKAMAGRIVYPEPYGTPASAYEVLANSQNRALPLDRAKGRANDGDQTGTEQSPQCFENLVRETWHRLELLHDRAMRCRNPEAIEFAFKWREHVGFEFNDLVRGCNSLKPRSMRLEAGASHWFKLVNALGTINLVGASFGDLVMPRRAMSAAMDSNEPAGLTSIRVNAVGATTAPYCEPRAARAIPSGPARVTGVNQLSVPFVSNGVPGASASQKSRKTVAVDRQVDDWNCQTRRMAHDLDLLCVPLSVLKNCVKKAGGDYVGNSIKVAKGFYWQYSDSCFEPCICGTGSSQHCSALVTKLERKPLPPKDHNRSRFLSAFDEHPNGAIVIGQPVTKGAKKDNEQLSASVATSSGSNSREPSMLALSTSSAITASSSSPRSGLLPSSNTSLSSGNRRLGSSSSSNQPESKPRSTFMSTLRKKDSKPKKPPWRP